MQTRRWYPLLLVALVAAISLGAVVSIPSLRGWHLWGPFAVQTAAEPLRVAQAGTPARAPVIPTQPPALVPDAAAVPAPHAHRLRARPAWAPSDRQRMLDRVYLAGKQNRPDDAVAALEAWDAQHPNDPEVLRELARLQVRGSRVDDGFARYRALLALRPDSSVRAEYASALLATQRYDSAAANFRVLTADDNTNVDYHLGLGRALAWGNHPRDAEPELHWVVDRTPSDTVLVTMLRLARGAFDPSAGEAASWVADDPTFPPYRLALARANMREHRFGLAAASFDTLFAMTPRPSLALVREAASAHSSAADSVGDTQLLGRAVALSPLDLTLRRSYAEALAWSGDRAGAIAQYDALLAGTNDPDLLLARGRLYAWTGNSAAAERDLCLSAALSPTPEAWVMLGDLYRWRGDRTRAQDAYDRAIALHFGDREAASGLDALAAAERHDAYVTLRNDLGLFPFSSFVGDNAGFSLYTAGVRDGLALGSRSALTLGLEGRRIGAYDAIDRPAMNGWAADAGLVHYVGGFRLAADGGIARHESLGDFGFGSVTAAGPWNRIWTSVELRSGAAYQVLMSVGALRYSDALASATIPFGRVALSGGVDQMWLSDGNSRNSVNIGVRYVLGYGLSAVYAGGMIGFDHGSDSYWDPRRYSSHAVGLEFASQHEDGLSFTARVLPGIGVSTDAFTGTPDQSNRSAAQLSSNLAMDYRRRWWDLRLDGDYAQGVRGSGYHSARARAGVRITP
jgi:tetratricopeptide (TPR) repeat protein